MSQTEHDGRGGWCEAHRWLASKAPVEQVAVASLRKGNSPRLGGDSKDRVAQLRVAVEVPPIIVHRSTMQIIDGGRRAADALCQHQDTIAVQFFEGSVEAAFVLAVVSNNVTHGLPLSLQDRKAAAARIIGMYPDWSDRLIASVAGLTHPTVATIRRNLSTGKTFQSRRRLSRDGKTRPAAPNDDPGRGASKQTSAHAVHSVRAQGASVIKPSSPTTGGAVSDSRIARAYVALQRLWGDPALHTDKGRALLRLLWRSHQQYSKVLALSAGAPEHCRDTLADAASAIGDSWAHLARDLQQQSQSRAAATALTNNESGGRGCNG